MKVDKTSIHDGYLFSLQGCLVIPIYDTFLLVNVYCK